MNKFKVGDYVVRIKSEHEGVYVGNSHVVRSVGDMGIKLEGLNFWHSRESYKLSTSKHHKHHDLIVAWAKGAVIQCRNATSLGMKEWRTNTVPQWDEDLEYRIKPTDPNADKINELEKKARLLADEIAKLRE